MRNEQERIEGVVFRVPVSLGLERLYVFWAAKSFRSIFNGGSPPVPKGGNAVTFDDLHRM